MSSTSTHKQQTQKEEKATTPTSNPITNEPTMESLEKIDSNFLIHLRKMNDQLDNEEYFNKLNRPVRHLLYKQDILNNQLIQLYKIASNNLINFDLNDLSKLFEVQQTASNNTCDVKPHANKLNSDYRKCFKLIQTHIELCKLTVDLTTPIELLLINRHFIYNTLSKLDLYDHHEQNFSNLQAEMGEPHSTSAPGSTSAESTSKIKNLQAINASLSAIIDDNLEKFKDLFFKLNYFEELATSLGKMIKIYQHLSNILADLVNNDKNQQPQTDFSNTIKPQSKPKMDADVYNKSSSNSMSTNSLMNTPTKSSRFKKLRLLKSLLLDDIILNLCLVRNLSFERNETKLNHFICNLIKYKLDKSLITLCNINEMDLSFKDKANEKHSFVISSLLCQIMSLLFSQLNTLYTKNSTSQTNTSSTNDKNNKPTSSHHHNHHHKHQSQNTKQTHHSKASCDESVVIEDECRNKLNEFGMSLCKSGAFAYLIENQLKWLGAPHELHGYFDVCYFLWLVKFITNNFVLKQVYIDSDDNINFTNTSDQTKHDDLNSSKLNQHSNHHHKQAQINNNKFTLEKSFLNSTKSKWAIKTKKCLMSFDLLSFVCFEMLKNFEQLIFDSNLKNMDRIRYYRIKHQQSVENVSILFNNKAKSNIDAETIKKEKIKSTFKRAYESNYKPAKIANTNCLRVLYLSINCLYELIDCINHHLTYLNSSVSKIKPNETRNNIENVLISSDLNKGIANNSNSSMELMNVDQDNEILNTGNIKTTSTTATQPTYKLNETHISQNLEDMRTMPKDEYLDYLNEFLNFDDFKQSFSLIMRFYCYNEHVYTKSLLKNLLLTNQLFLNTYQNVYDYIRELEMKEQDKEQIESTVSDTNATKNSSVLSCLNKKPIDIHEIYNLYANGDTSFILKHVLVEFAYNDPVLNRCVIDLLDMLMAKSSKRERLFHMNLALALANIATLENFRMLDQRTKDVVSHMLIEIKRICKYKPDLANKILFDMHHRSHSKDYDKNSRSRKRMRINNNENKDNVNYLETRANSKQTTSSSSWSSLRSTTFVTDSTNSKSPDSKSEDMDARNEAIIREKDIIGNPIVLSKELRTLIENEFLFCLHSLDAFNKTNCDKKIDPKRMYNFIIKNDHLYWIFSYLVQLFESFNDKLTSWQIYHSLLNMKFNMGDKLDYLKRIKKNDPNSVFSMGLNLGYSPNKDTFFKSNQCINLRVACSTEEFQKELKEAYIKFLIEKLCLKSKRTKTAIYWLFNRLRQIKYYLLNRIDSSLSNQADPEFAFLPPSASSIFEIKLLSYYYNNKLGIPFIPFTYELQQVFHSVDFSHLLDILGIVRANNRFPYLTMGWLENIYKLNECITLIEKCICM